MRTSCFLSLAILLVGAHMAAAQDTGPYGSLLDRPDRHPFADRTAVRNPHPQARTKTTVEERLLPKTAIAPTADARGSVQTEVPNLEPATYSAHPDRAAEPLTSSQPIPSIWNAEPISEPESFVFEGAVPQVVRTCRARSAAQPFSASSGSGAVGPSQASSNSTAATEAAPQQRGAEDNKTRAKN